MRIDLSASRGRHAPSKSALRAAFVTAELPFARVAGHQRVNMAALDLLRARGCRIDVLLALPRLQAPIAVNPFRDIHVAGPGIRSSGHAIIATRPQAFAKLAAKFVVERAPPLVQSLTQRLRRKIAPASEAILGKFIGEKQIAWLAGWIARERPDVVLLDTIFQCPLIPHLAPPRPKTVVLTHDVFHLRHASLAGRGLDLMPKDLSRAQECALLAPADVIVAINAEERSLLQAMAPSAHVIEAGMPVVPVPRPAAITRNLKQSLFVGSGGIHNVDGLRWLLAEVWPLVRADVPDARLEVCGLVSRGVTLAPPGVTLHGRVTDLTPLLHRSGLALCPLKAGSGLKIKMLDYFGHGLPCVTTSVGAQGFRPAADLPFVVADEPRRFADAMVGFMREPEKIAAFEARAYAYCDLYSEERVFADLAVELLDAFRPLNA